MVERCSRSRKVLGNAHICKIKVVTIMYLSHHACHTLRGGKGGEEAGEFANTTKTYSVTNFFYYFKLIYR